jgi:hypothetical protein
MKTAGIASALIALALTGCASMSKDECLNVDWRTVGYEDGAAGRSGEAIGQHRKACAAAGVVPNLDAYRAGRAEGLREFCRPQNGYRVGLSGMSYGGICPEDLAPAFLQAYDAGQELHAREYRVSYAGEQLEHMRRQLDTIEHQMTEAGLATLSPTSTIEERAQALIETKQLAERHERLETDIAQLERDKRRYEQELQDYRAQVASAG